MKHIKKGLLLFFFASVLVNNSVLASNGPNGKLVLPSNITDTNKNKNANNTSLQSLEIPGNVTRIIRESFKRCTNLSEIVIHDGLEVIDSLAFTGCSSLRNIQLPSTIKIIARDAFSYNNNLTKISFALGTSNCVVKKDAFYNSNNIKEITSYGGVTFEDAKYNTIMRILEEPFHSEYATLELQKLTINEGVAEIPSDEFAGCTRFTSLVVPTSVTKINARSFKYCENLEEVYLPDSLQEINESTFEGCFNLKHISLPQTLEIIYTGAFKGCYNLEYIHLSTSLNVIGDESFYGCERLLELNIPNKTTYIGTNCLSGCTSLKSLVLPNSVTILENMFGETRNTDLRILINDFDGDANLTHNRLTEYGIREDSIENAYENGNTSEVITNEQIDLDDEDIQDALSHAKVLNVYTENIPDNFYWQMIDAKIINFHEGVEVIGHNVLVNPLSIDDEDTYGPVEIILPDTLESIGGNSIYGWQNLRFVSLSENISEIGYNVFAGCENLKIIEIRASDEGNFEVIKTLLMLAGVSEDKIRWCKK